MDNLWLKIKFWTKAVVFGVLFIYAIIFIDKNLENTADVWIGYNNVKKPSTLSLTLFAFLAGVIGTILVRTITSTLRQMRDARDRERQEKDRQHAEMLQRKLDELKAKTEAPAENSAPAGENAT